MPTTTNLDNFVINYLTQAQYDAAKANNTLNENQLYLTPPPTTLAGYGITDSAGSATKPIYLNNGAPTECSDYAGGTAVTLNGTSKAASTASFYAPIDSGTSGYILESKGASAAPDWIEILGVAHGGTGLTTTTNVNAVVIGNSTSATSALQTVATAQGAFYSSGTNAKPQFGTLPVNCGGTGVSTIASGEVLIGSGTSGIATRAIKNMTAKNHLTWTSANTDNTIVTTNTLAYWNGRYNSTSSNLEYCNKGAFGDMATKTASDYIAKAIGTAKGDIIYWSSASTPARLAIGTAGHFLKATANGPAYSALTSTEVTTALGFTPYNSTNPNGYISSYTETDPVFAASAAAGITSTDITNWNNKTSNTGTITGVTAGSGLSGGGTSGSVTLNHSNSVTAQTTQAVYPIKIDAQGHISAYGTAVTIGTMAAQSSDSYVKKAGDTMTGNLTVSRSDHSNDTGFIAINTDSTNPLKIGYIIGSSGNGGIYDYTHGAWKLKITPDGTATFAGTATAATKATQDGSGNTITSTYVKKAGDTMTGNLIISKTGDAYVEAKNTETGCRIEIDVNAAGKHGLWSSGYYANSTYTASSKWIYYRGTDGEAHSDVKIYGAVFNDYAEYRTTKNYIEPGRCIIETGNDDLILSTTRLQPGAEIVSDTFGFAIGQTKESNTPIASNGRVLAYIYEGREAAKNAIGKPVCSGPNGTVSIMTDEEYQKYGYCAIGTISSIPSYETWGTDNIKVNGRIWIRIK